MTQRLVITNDTQATAASGRASVLSAQLVALISSEAIRLITEMTELDKALASYYTAKNHGCCECVRTKPSDCCNDGHLQWKDYCDERQKTL